MTIFQLLKPQRFATKVFKTIAACLLLMTLSGNASAELIERTYAANSCKGLLEQPDTEGSWQFIWNGAEGIFGNTQGTNGVSRVVCPIVRQKIGSSAGIQFFVYFSGVVFSLGDRVSCTMTSRRARNGALVSTGTATNVNQASTQVLLRKFLPVNASHGHLNLQCTSNNIFSVMHNYRIREF